MDLLRSFWNDETAAGVVEVLLVLIVLVGLTVIFKSQLTSVVNNIFSKLTSNVNTVIK